MLPPKVCSKSQRSNRTKVLASWMHSTELLNYERVVLQLTTCRLRSDACTSIWADARRRMNRRKTSCYTPCLSLDSFVKTCVQGNQDKRETSTSLLIRGVAMPILPLTRFVTICRTTSERHNLRHRVYSPWLLVCRPINRLLALLATDGFATASTVGRFLRHCAV